ncbi:MAG TPA: hypothetical protein VGG40_05725 [Solirubrobacterales bacterium]|jgi:hypothetical protein
MSKQMLSKGMLVLAAGWLLLATWNLIKGDLLFAGFYAFFSVATMYGYRRDQQRAAVRPRASDGAEQLRKSDRT